VHAGCKKDLNGLWSLGYRACLCGLTRVVLQRGCLVMLMQRSRSACGPGLVKVACQQRVLLAGGMGSTVVAAEGFSIVSGHGLCAARR